MKKQTAVGWIEDNIQSDMTFMDVLGLIRQAKELEKQQDKKMYSEEELRNAMNWTLTQYFEFHECPTTGRMDHYVQSIKQQEQ
jgi:hypothetical protein